MTILTVLFTDLPRLLGLGRKKRKKIITDKHNPRRTFWFKNVLISLLTDLWSGIFTGLVLFLMPSQQH